MRVVQLPNEQSVIEQFGHNVVRCRVAAELSQEVAARRAGLHGSHITLLENGKRNPQLDTLLKLAGAFGVEPEELFRGIAWRPTTDHRPGGFYIPPNTKGRNPS